MTKVFSILAIVIAVFSIQSCKKCGHCELNGVRTSPTYCEKDDQETYDDRKATCEYIGSASKWVVE